LLTNSILPRLAAGVVSRYLPDDSPIGVLCDQASERGLLRQQITHAYAAMVRSATVSAPLAAVAMPTAVLGNTAGDARREQEETDR
jgi:hypothetical protein